MMFTDFSILVADDNEMNRWLLAEQLQYWCDDISQACDGLEAWALLQSRRYSMVFLDVNMPGLNGFEVVKKAREESLNRSSPIVAVTAHVQSHQRHLLLDDGFNDCLIKPIVLGDLQQVISHWCKPTAEGGSQYYAQALLNKVEHNRALGQLFLQKLMQEIPSQLADLGEALQSQQHQTALDIAHKLHGSFCFYGFEDLRLIAGQLEQGLLEVNMSKAKQQYQLLSAGFANLLAMQHDVMAELLD